MPVAALAAELAPKSEAAPAAPHAANPVSATRTAVLTGAPTSVNSVSSLNGLTNATGELEKGFAMLATLWNAAAWPAYEKKDGAASGAATGVDGAGDGLAFAPPECELFV